MLNSYYYFFKFGFITCKFYRGCRNQTAPLSYYSHQPKIPAQNVCQYELFSNAALVFLNFYTCADFPKFLPLFHDYVKLLLVFPVKFF